MAAKPVIFGGDCRVVAESAVSAALTALAELRDRSIKRVASAVGEGAMVIQHVHAYLAERSTG